MLDTRLHSSNMESWMKKIISPDNYLNISEAEKQYI